MTVPAIAIDDLAKTYAGGRVGLDGVSLRVDEGAFFGLLGPNGAGKTTLIGLLTSLLRLERGRVQVFGHDLAREPVAAKRLVGLVPQEVNFNSFEPVGEIIETQGAYYGLSPREARRRTGELCERLGLADRRRQTAWGLSGGFKRRLLIARALVHRPRLLVLDEPTAGVDLEARHDLWALLQELNADGVTILLTTHYLEEAERLCRQLAIIDGGRFIAEGSTAELLRGLRFQTLVVELAEPVAQPEALDGALSRGTLRSVDAHTLEVDVPRGAELNPVFAELTAAGVRIAGLREKGNRLESRFLELLRERGSGEGAA
ncbi:ABC transporter ATP-binding protein [Thioalkalivibrio sp. ALM2T]|uniref:ABC transporter ATP-binding protein n=1 Tax=Thioalkalivibrio sp. ALM2T TaxID=1158184 RepID=UPI000375F59A|nr:ABC transporter ATP-binding protein [Thioalkalivibrio sp. ALM2T]